MSTSEQYLPAFLEEVVGDRFGRYSKYIIQDRAIPDVRDGLKPVQRRIVYAMYEAGNTPDKGYRKSAKTVGDVMGNYHPHGDSSIYDGMVRMAQSWKMAHPLIDGHGNWGSMDDDPPAAMRYTEARLSSIAMELVRDIEKDTVQFKDNFDNTVQEPVVLPARYPNLLVNGVSGISSGFATEIPTHNLQEVIDACIALTKNEELSLEELMGIVKGPDFPTGGIIMGAEGIREAYRTGKGKIFIKAKTEIEDMRGGKQQIVITEIPYQVVKSKLVTAMETIRLDKKVEGISEVRDESGRNGLRIVIELKKDADAQGILAYLLKKTDLQVNYNFNMVAIVNKTPKQLGLRELLSAYIEHQKEVITRRTGYDLDKAEDRAHVLEGLVKALNILDEVIETIKASNNRQEAHDNLKLFFGFTDRQAESILTLQLYRLTNLEISSLQKELDDIQQKILQLKSILNSGSKLMGVIREELLQIRKKFGLARRSVIQEDVDEIKVNLEVMVSPEDVLVTLSRDGYIKRSSLLSFNRSGGEMAETGLKEGDMLRYGFASNTIHTLLIFTEKGQYFVLPVHQIPEYKWKDTGTAIVNVIPIATEDQIVSVIPIERFDADHLSLLFVSRRGQVKRTELKQYESNRSMAITACKVGQNDQVIAVMLSDRMVPQDVLLVSEAGMCIRFDEQSVNAMGRNSAGVKGMSCKGEDHLVAAMLVPTNDGYLIVASDRGYMKKTPLQEYIPQNRGGKGQQTFEFKEGKRIRSNGEKLIWSALSEASETWTAKLDSGDAVEFQSQHIPIEERRATGKQMIAVKKEGTIEVIYRLPEPSTTREE